MRQFAFTFGQPYDLHDAYVLVEADTAEEATAQFVEARRNVEGGMPGAQHRWMDCVPFEGSIVEAFKGMRTVEADTPIHYRKKVTR